MTNIAVLLPAYNEELTIKKVIEDVIKELPNSNIYIYDNASTDNTSKIVKELIKINKNIYYKFIPIKGKGNVVRAMINDIDADIYILIDSDDTYPIKDIHKLISKSKHYDMVVGDRISNGSYKQVNNRPFHNIGNRIVTKIINKLFDSNLNDIMSGYRVLNKNFAKNLPIIYNGFEVETEITLHALDKSCSIYEVPIHYRSRPHGSRSKLSTFRDGFKILATILFIFRDFKPLIFFGFLGIFTFILSILVGIPVIIEFIKYHYIYKVPSAILATGLMIISIISFFSGFILDSIKNHNRRIYEVQRLQNKTY